MRLVAATRRVVTSTFATVLLHTSLPRLPAAAAGLEEVRKAASVLPGYGPPDILFPPAFKGRWKVTRTVVAVTAPLGQETAPKGLLKRARDSEAVAIEFEQRFVQDRDPAGVISDRAFNAERRTAAVSGTALDDLQARWEPSNPNVLTLATLSSGSVVETKVTKRSFEAPYDGAFGTSEYARVADAGSSGVLGGVPVILATRVQMRYRWETAEASGAAPTQIEALEITQTFDPTATGFADLAGATPVLTTKARLKFARI